MYAPDAPTPRPPKEVWDTARSHLRLQLPRSTFETWVRDTTCLAHEDGAFVIGVANAYAKDWLSLRLRPLIKRTLAGIVGHAVDVTFVVQPIALEDAPDAPPVPLLAYESPAEVALPTPTTTFGANLNPRYTFDTFIVGSSNRMAHAVAMSVAERPGTAYNPLFLYGGSGLGKTHLLQAIGQVVQASGSAGFVRHLGSFHQRADRRDPHPDHRAVSSKVSHDRRAAARRHPFHCRQGADAGGVLPHLQRAALIQPADRADQRPAAAGDPARWKNACARVSAGA